MEEEEWKRKERNVPGMKNYLNRGRGGVRNIESGNVRETFCNYRIRTIEKKSREGQW